MKPQTKLKKLSWKLQQLKQGLLFGAWDCGIKEPEYKERFYRRTLNKVIVELESIARDLEETK